jgi:hypothetical protein
MARVQRPSLPRLALDPDARLVRWGWIFWGALTIFLIAYLLFLRSATGAPVQSWVSAAPLAALWLLWPLVRGGGAFWRWMHAAPHVAWNDSYYEFDGRQIRVLFDENEIYVVAADVFAALGLRGHATDTGRARVIAGRDGLQNLPGSRAHVFTEHGLSAWLERRTEKQSVDFQRWLEREVIAPHRRRRAKQTGV